MIKGKCGIDKKAFEILLWYSFPLDCSWAFVALWAHQGAFKIEKVLLALNCGVSLTKGRHFCKHQERRPICLNSGRKQARGLLSNCCFCCFFLYFFGGKIDLGGFTSDDLWYHEAIGLTPFPDFRTTREALWGVVLKKGGGEKKKKESTKCLNDADKNAPNSEKDECALKSGESGTGGNWER